MSEEAGARRSFAPRRTGGTSQARRTEHACRKPDSVRHSRRAREQSGFEVLRKPSAQDAPGRSGGALRVRGAWGASHPVVSRTDQERGSRRVGSSTSATHLAREARRLAYPAGALSSPTPRQNQVDCARPVALHSGGRSLFAAPLHWAASGRQARRCRGRSVERVWGLRLRARLYSRTKPRSDPHDGAEDAPIGIENAQSIPWAFEASARFRSAARLGLRSIRPRDSDCRLRRVRRSARERRGGCGWRERRVWGVGRVRRPRRVGRRPVCERRRFGDRPVQRFSDLRRAGHRMRARG
jgi:hypothetical protein